MTARDENAAGGGAPTPASTSGVQMSPNPWKKENMMTNRTAARPWLDADPEGMLTEADVARLDLFAAPFDNDSRLADDLRQSVRAYVQVRHILGNGEPELPSYVTTEPRFPGWELAENGTEAVRYLDSEHCDEGRLHAILEVDQYSTGRRDHRVQIDEGQTSDPRELARFAGKLLELATRWESIERGEAR